MLVASLIALASGDVGVMFWESELPRPIRQLLPAGVAVLPFENLSADPENAFFTDGVQDEVLNNLAKIADLKVISRTSVMQYKSGAKRNLRQIANELGVAHVVEGSVQRAANRVRVTAQLIDARTTGTCGTSVTIDHLTTSLRSRAKSPKRLPLSFRLNCRQKRKRQSRSSQRLTLVAYDLY